MIIAGPCLYTDIHDSQMVLDTAQACKDIGVDQYRVKLWGGGTTPEKYNYGIGYNGIETLKYINENIMQAGTEVHTKSQIQFLLNITSFLWVGARNSQNYTLLKDMVIYPGEIFIKRGSAMTIDETIGIYDICKDISKYTPYIVERGITTFDRLSDSRWSPDLKGAIRLKQERPDIFERLVIDCSHSVGRKEYIQDTYNAFKSIGINHFMFECTIDGKSKTDQRHMLSVKELDCIINENRS